VKIAGVNVAAAAVIDLARHLRREGAGEIGDAIEDALIKGAKQARLELTEREVVLRALATCPDELAELRAALLDEHVDRQRQGAEVTSRPPAAGHAAPSAL
jgi:hypothetical protein